jgi:hypothetical protein
VKECPKGCGSGVEGDDPALEDYLLKAHAAQCDGVRQAWQPHSTQHTSTDCRTPDGVTTSLLDGLIGICRVLRQRDLTTPGAAAALRDAQADEDVRALLTPGATR